METFSPKPFAGWAQSGVPWERAPILALLSLAALLVPMATGKAFYCHQLCPHGAAQQWMRKFRKPSASPKGWTEYSIRPVGLLVWWYFLPSPFGSYGGYPRAVRRLRMGSGRGLTIAIALISLFASAFVPMAYCRYGCPTGTVLKLFEFKKEEGWNTRDYLSLALV